MCNNNTGGHSNTIHGVHCENGHLTDACLTVTVDKRSPNNNNNRNRPDINGTSDNNNNNHSNTNTIGTHWVRNLSKTPLTEAQECLLAHGPNFVIVPKEPPICEYIVATEKACQHLMQGKVEELRGEIKSILKKKPNTKPNISREEYQALKEIRKDNTKMVLTANKGVSMVVVDREEYIQKSEELLQQPNYKILQSDPTTKYKNKLISLLKSIKAEGGIDENTYRRLYPTGAVPPKYYGLPKVHKQGMPLRPIISSIGSVTHATAKELSRILKTFSGKINTSCEDQYGLLTESRRHPTKP